MAFNREDKVSWDELAPTLQEKIDSKLDTTIFESHKNNMQLHVSETDRINWNFAYTQIKSLTGDSSTLLQIINSKISKEDFDEFKNSLKKIATTADFADLINVPKDFLTVNGIRITVGNDAPQNPLNNKEIWFTTDYITYFTVLVYNSNIWHTVGTAFKG